MSIQTVRRAEIAVVGLSIETQPMSAEIPALWPRFMARVDEIRNPLEPNVSYGVMRYEPAARPVLHYMAAVSVGASGGVPAGMTRLTLPAGEYARFTYPLGKLSQGFCEIHESLLPASGYIQSEGHFFERYDEAFDPGNPDSMVEILIPVRRR